MAEDWHTRTSESFALQSLHHSSNVISSSGSQPLDCTRCSRPEQSCHEAPKDAICNPKRPVSGGARARTLGTRSRRTGSHNICRATLPCHIDRALGDPVPMPPHRMSLYPRSESVSAAAIREGLAVDGRRRVLSLWRISPRDVTAKHVSRCCTHGRCHEEISALDG